MSSENRKKRLSKDSAEQNETRKASSLNQRDQIDSARVGSYKADGRKVTLNDARREAERRHTQVWVDILLIFLLLLLIAGAIFGYRILKRVYAPKGEDKEVVIHVQVPAVDGEILPKYWVLNSAVTILDDEGGTMTATLLDPPDYYYTLPAEQSPESGVTYKSFTMALSVNAYYLEGKGYFLGDLPLRAGGTHPIRVNGISADAMIISLYEKAEYDARLAEQETETVAAQSGSTP